MSKIIQRASAFVRSEDGPTAVEYGVMLALIVVAAIAAISLLGQNAADMMTSVAEDIEISD